MLVRMRALQQAVGPVEWNPGDEIEVSEEVAVKFERSGMAERIAPVKYEDLVNLEAAILKTTENASRRTARGRNRA